MLAKCKKNEFQSLNFASNMLPMGFFKKSINSVKVKANKKFNNILVLSFLNSDSNLIHL